MSSRLLAIMVVLAAGCVQLPKDAGLGRDREVSLAGRWSVLLDPGGVGVRDDWLGDILAGRKPDSAPADALLLDVPGPLPDSYDGTAWYATRFHAPADAVRARLRLRFERVNYACRVWLDGLPLGEHEGGYSPFGFDLTGKLTPGEHSLVAMVVDPGAVETFGLSLKGTPHAKESWYHNFGGILGAVSLGIDHGFELQSLRVSADRATEVRADLAFVGQGAAAEVTLRVEGAGAVTLASVPIVDGLGRASVSLWPELLELEPWTLDEPRLHRVTVEVDGEEIGFATFGLRDVALDEDGFRLNGERIVLKGVLWQPHFTGGGGLDPSAAELEAEVRAILDTGFNLVRAHVRPAPEAFLDACDRLGLMVLEELPVGWVDDDPLLERRMLAEVDAMVTRDAHHPSIVMWGALNEASGKGYRHAASLMQRFFELDSSRPVLEDSGGFLGGGRYLPARAQEFRLLPMVDEHFYPPWPLSPDERDRMRHASGGPVFASEFGFGTLVKAAQAVAGFQRRGLQGEESELFQGMLGTARRAWKDEGTWSETGWIEQAQELQADAAEDMVEALRSNPEVDMFCYTQWRAVSRESSAGLLEPWGESRPAHERMRHALRPLMATVTPERASAREGDVVKCSIAVVNDTGATVHAEVSLWSTPGRLVRMRPLLPQVIGSFDFSPGVTTLAADVPFHLGIGGVHAVLRELGQSVEVSTERRVPCTYQSTEVTTVWPVGDDGVLAARLEELGLQVGREDSRVACIVRPADLARTVSFDERQALWNFVRQGGTAVVLLDDPSADPIERLLGAGRGAQTLSDFPVPLRVAPAAGNFMGRIFLSREGEDVRLLGRGDELISPQAMLLGDSEASLITVGFLGDRVGAVVADVPYGEGRFRCVGLPLLADVNGEEDVFRSWKLGQILVGASRRESDATEPWAALAPDQSQALAFGCGLIDQVVALAERHSRAAGAAALPEEVDVALAGKNAALLALQEGRLGEAAEGLQQAVVSVWNEEVAAFLALEEQVRGQLRQRIEADSPEARVEVHEAMEDWMEALAAWFGGSRQAARDWLGRAELLLREGG